MSIFEDLFVDSFVFLDSPQREKKRNIEEEDEYTDSVAPNTAMPQRSGHATAPRLVNQHLTPVAKIAPTSVSVNSILVCLCVCVYELKEREVTCI